MMYDMFQERYLISLRDLCICVAYADRWAATVFVVLAVLIENEEKQFKNHGFRAIDKEFFEK